ncbi:MAG TPA: PAS domain-containing protein, partial [Polyangiaceae bacterium]|nr:PAS domain-containing protein [Polyangiaceae bacterium]
MHALAHILASQSEHISTQWLSRLGRTSPHLAQRTPQLLAELSTVFDERFGEPAAATPSVRERWRHPRGFELAQVVEEYSALRDCVLDTFEAAGASMGVRELRVLIDFFAQALAEAVSDHTEQARSAELANQLAASASRDAEREALLLREQAARAEAQAERVKLHELFMQAPVPIAIVEGPAHTFTFANPAYRALVNGREVLGKPLLEALPDLAGQGFDLLLDDVKKTGKAFVGLEVPVKLEHHGEGQVLWLNFTYTPKRDAAGVAEGVLVAAADVTEQVLARQRTEALAEAVRSSETELRLVTDAVPVLISFVTPDERYGMVNKAYERWFGVSTEELVGRKLEDVLGKPAYERMRPYVLRGLAGEHVSFEQHGVPYRLGGNKDVSVKFVPRYSASGDVDGYVALIEDITARRQLHAKAEQLAQQRTDDLEAAGDLLRSFVNNLPELAWSAAPDGSVDFYNQRWFDYTGTTFEEVKGWGWETLHDPA